MNRARRARLCGWIGLTGAVLVVVANLAGVAIYEQHDPISDTISDLAAGRWGWIQDTGLILFGIGAMACAYGLWPWWRGRASWMLGLAALALLGIDLGVIAGHNEYGDRDSGKFVIHMNAVYAFAVLFLAQAALLGPGLRDARFLSGPWRTAGFGVAAAWLVLSPLFFVVPTTWDGAYERFLGLITVGWIAALSLALIRRARQA
ncbi:hypothetical protein C882_1250 [Caenispirillum salinarum AK4]|uniref:DUF998 domain-containing protein n=1 Tax=Caenispirillum salinarum AK4 TaxID=1238182 RepID=K9GP11_9PROT|nr:DUF998 domain-containing protein [Caenispirillum salinarum]EKV27655.1 hypothetical protein C882_1250 [Caenispirillum salinarum AK4]